MEIYWIVIIAIMFSALTFRYLGILAKEEMIDSGIPGIIPALLLSMAAIIIYATIGMIGKESNFKRG